MNFDEYYVNMADTVATKSKDRSTKVGCVLVSPEPNGVISTGYNGFPRGIDDEVENRHGRPQKYQWSEHSERNAIYNAARRGIITDGATAYISRCNLFCCVDCARALIQSGIRRVVAPRPDTDNPRWNDSMSVSIQMLMEADVEITFHDEIIYERDIQI